MAVCIYCLEEIEERVERIESTRKLKGEDVTYMESVAYCPICGNEISVPEISDANLDALYDAYREQESLISYNDVLCIAEKYDISKRNFSLLLGWGEHTFERFCDGYIPSRQYSDKLKELIRSERFDEVLENYKDSIDIGAYTKAKKALKKSKLKYATEPPIKIKNSRAYSNSNNWALAA